MGSPIISGMWDEASMLDVGHACEQATGWRQRRPAIAD
jgi:Asp-tRNA(Asn)/Glu-tRNA(Gln) amidotransferase A subunit family amidase